MIDSLKQLHDAIVAGLHKKLTGIPSIECYPTLSAQHSLPAIFIELVDMKPGSDPGTGETALIGRFQARVMIDTAVPDAQMQARELATQVAVALTHETWELDIHVAQLIQIIEDSTPRPEPASCLVWIVEWTHEFHLGVSAWPYPDDTGKTILFGLDPDTGAGKENLYTAAATELLTEGTSR